MISKIVIDTNVIVSAALSPKGNPARILDLVADDAEIEVYYSAEMMAEYEKVLSRDYLNISYDAQHAMIEAIKSVGIPIKPSASGKSMPDEDDRVFYDTAKASEAILITGNKKHYPDEPFIMTPADFLAQYQTGTTGKTSNE